jgi:hypothetical protein
MTGIITMKAEPAAITSLTPRKLSASDLLGYLYCRHLSALDRAVAEGTLKKPQIWDPLQEILWERGARLKQFSGHASLKSLEEYVELDELRHNHLLKDIL